MIASHSWDPAWMLDDPRRGCVMGSVKQREERLMALPAYPESLQKS